MKHRMHRATSSKLSSRRRYLAAMALVSVSASTPAGVFAQGTGNAPLEIVVPWGPGGSSDTLPRLLAPYLSAELGRPVVINNRPGGHGMPAINAVLSRPADGNTLFAADSSHWAAVPALQSVNYDFLADFALVSLVFTTPHLWVVSPSSPIKSLEDLIDLARKSPEAINFASVGVGSASHIQLESFAYSQRIKLSPVFYKSAGEAAIALQRGDVQLWVNGIAAPAPFVKAGKMKALAVGGNRQFPTFPDVKTVSEITGLKSFDWAAKQGWVVRAGTPKHIVNELTTAIARASAKALADSDTAAKIIDTAGVELEAAPPEVFRKQILSDVKKYNDTVRQANLKQH